MQIIKVDLNWIERSSGLLKAFKADSPKVKRGEVVQVEDEDGTTLKCQIVEVTDDLIYMEFINDN